MLHGDVLEQLRLAELLGPGPVYAGCRQQCTAEPAPPGLQAARLVDPGENGTPQRVEAAQHGPL
ncbi:MAG: hypothetical protein ACT4QG_07415, partial [Sporichthyaceae bacterium]